MAKNAIIWGATGGIGHAMGHLLTQNDYQVYGIARDADAIDASFTMATSFDATSEDSIAQAVREVAGRTTAIDLMVYAVGSLDYEKLDDMTVDGFQSTVISNPDWCMAGGKALSAR